MNTDLIDVLDENGVLTGEVLPRNEVHEKGLWHRAIIVAIIIKIYYLLLHVK